MAQICKTVVDSDLNVREKILEPLSPAIEKTIIINEYLERAVNLDSLQLSAGRTHNVILSVLNNSIQIDTLRVDSISNELYYNILNSEDFGAVCSSTMNEFANNSFIEEDPLLERVLELFKQAFTEYTANCSDIVSVINKYVEVINETEELTDEEKDRVKYCFATALYSFNYWSKYLNQNN